MTNLKIYVGEQPEFTRDEIREAVLYGMASQKLGMDCEQAVKEYIEGLGRINKSKNILDTSFVNERNEH